MRSIELINFILKGLCDMRGKIEGNHSFSRASIYFV